MYANLVRRTIARLLIILSLSGCQFKSRWSDLKIEAVAYVDNRPVSADTLWRVRSVQAFPPGASIEGTGVALAIPVAPGRYVYGLFRTLYNDEDLRAWDAFLTGVDASVAQHARIKSVDLNFSEMHDRVIDVVRGRQIEMCLPDQRIAIAQNRCLVFVYFTRPQDPTSLKLVRPGIETDLGGVRFRLQRVTATYQEPGGPSMSEVGQLPSFVRSPDGRGFGVLPEGLKIQADRPLGQSDFWRSQ